MLDPEIGIYSSPEIGSVRRIKEGKSLNILDQSLETCQRNGAWNKGPSVGPISPRISGTVDNTSQSVTQGLPDKFQE